LEKLSKPITEPQLNAIETAVAAINQGKSFVDICIILSKSTAFKKNLPVFEKKNDFGMLGKRKEQEKSKEERKGKF
jgi:hypothetical protein